MKRTFALTELIIVLLILGILVGLSMFKYTQSTRLANRTIFENNLKEIIKALEDYKMHQQFEDFSYPASLDMLKGSEIFTKEPINPYTGKSMLSNNSADSGLQYQSTGDKYKLCVVQNDIDDINNNGITDELLPLTTSDICFDNTQSQISVNFNRPTVAYTSNGIQVATGVPRYGEGKFGQAIFIEEDTTNLLTLGWWRAPELERDLTTAWHGDASLRGVKHIIFSISTSKEKTPITAEVPYTGSVYTKSSAPQSQLFILYWHPGNTGASTSADFTTEWRRAMVSGIAPLKATESYLELYSNGNHTIWWDGAQLEAKPYATSWTSGGTRREAETLSISPVSSILTTRQGTIDVWVYVPDFWKSGIPNSRRIWTIGTATETGVYYLGYNPTNDQIEFSVVSDVGTAQTIRADKPSIGWHLLTTRWSNNEMSLWIDGVMVGSIINPVLPSRFADNKLYLGNMPNISMSAINTYIDDFRISSIARTDIEIQTLYQNNQPAPKDADTTLIINFDGNLNIQSTALP